MNGTQLQDKVVTTAQMSGWKVAHFRPCKTQQGWRTAVQYDAQGWPDLYLVHPKQQLVLYREIKAEHEKLTPQQAEWGAWLTAAGQDWGVWRPSNWPRIVDTLTFGRMKVP